jgi:hypothetical protein
MESESLNSVDQDEVYIQYAAIIKTLGNVLKTHTSQKGVINPIIGAILSLRDKNFNLTFKSIKEELT